MSAVEYTGRIQLVDLARYGAPAGSMGYHYADLFFDALSPFESRVQRGQSAGECCAGQFIRPPRKHIKAGAALG